MTSQKELRQQHIKRRAGLSKEQVERASQALCERVIALDVYQQAGHIATYYSVNGEISLQPVIDHALAQGKKIYLPQLDEKTLRFSPYFHGQKMRINYFKLPEPDVGDEEMLQPEQLDLVLAPLVVFDEQRNRVGMGGGFYDRSFAFRKNPARLSPQLVGVAHEIQKTGKIEVEDWDVRLDMVVTDKAIYR